jgi:hypothetical protein
MGRSDVRDQAEGRDPAEGPDQAQHAITRRRFVAGTVATGAAAAVPAGAKAGERPQLATAAPSSQTADVVIVGAGLAGLRGERAASEVLAEL